MTDTDVPTPAEDDTTPGDDEPVMNALFPALGEAFGSILDGLFGPGTSETYALHAREQAEKEEAAEALRRTAAAEAAKQAAADRETMRRRRDFQARHTAIQTTMTTWLIGVLGFLVTVILAGAAVGIWRVAL